MNRICIVGLGWLGEELGVALKEIGFSVKGTTTSLEKIPSLKQKVDDVVHFNLSNTSPADLGKVDVLVYTIPPSSVEDYAQLSSTFLSAVRKQNPEMKIIYTSSTSVYGNGEREVTEKSTIEPKSSSAVKISEVEEYVQKSFSQWAILRMGGLVGGERHPVKYLAGRNGISKPLAPVNLLHREDAIGAILHLLANFETGVYNLCSENHPFKKVFYSAVASENNLATIEFDEGDITKDKVVNCNAIKKSGFEFKYTSPYDFPFEV